jgi:hypothetical protein
MYFWTQALTSVLLSVPHPTVDACSTLITDFKWYSIWMLCHWRLLILVYLNSCLWTKVPIWQSWESMRDKQQ